MSVAEILAEEPWRRVERDGVEYLLLGTAHVSARSVAAVTALLEQERFDAVAIELDPGRYKVLTEPEWWRGLDLFKVIREGKAGLVAANLVLGAYQRNIAEQFGIEPGAEMRAADQRARAAGLPVLLIDREVGLTLRRAAARLGFWRRLTLYGSLLETVLVDERLAEDEIEKLKQGDALQRSFGDFAAQAPALYECLIDERDRYMAAKLLTERPAAAKRILVVIGAGHLAGLERALNDPTWDPRAALAALERPPPPSRWPKWIGYGLLAVIIGGVAIGFSRDVEIGRELALLYLTATAIGALLGALLARAHPLSALTGACSAPLTVLHPALASGMFSAATELWLRRPRVADMEALRHDLSRWPGWWRNRVSRTLLVFFFTNLGTAFGAWTSGFEIVRRLS